MTLETLFLVPLNRSIAAGWLILTVLALRLLLVKAPKQPRVWLWGLVGLRLAMPVSLKSALSLIPSVQTVPQEFLYDPTPAVQSGIPAVDAVVEPILQGSLAPEPVMSANPAQILCFVAGSLWLAGCAGLLLYSLISYLLLRRRLRCAVRLHGDIWQCESVSVPFVLGVLRPRIYLPYTLTADAQEYVLAHEYAHIERRDPLVKAVGWLLVCLYWFHPLVWVAYALLCRDIELACDERVLHRLGDAARKAYSHALLEQSTGRRQRMAGVCPLAFGEGSVRQRIVNILRYKKPAVWITVLCILLCAVLAVCFLTDPAAAADPAKVVGPYDVTGLGGDFLHSGNDAYAVGANAYGMPVFLDHRAAYSAFLSEYAAGIEELRTVWKLDPISKKNYSHYKIYGWQTPCADEELNRQCYQVTLFFDLYENSFDMTVRTPAQPTLQAAEMQADFDLSDEAAQLPQVLEAFPPRVTKDVQTWPTSAAAPFIPEGAVCTEVSAIGQVVYIDYRYEDYRYLVAYKTDGTVEATISQPDVWTPGGIPMCIVNSAASGKIKYLNATDERMIQEYTGGEFLGMGIALSYMPEDGSYYETIRLCGDRLTVISSGGETLYDGGEPVVSRYSHGALLTLLSEAHTGVPEEAIPVYKGVDEMAVYTWYEQGSEEPAYSVWCFHGRPTWFAERTVSRIYTLDPAW